MSHEEFVSELNNIETEYRTFSSSHLVASPAVCFGEVAVRRSGMSTDDLSAVFLASSQDVAVLGSHSHGASDIVAYSVQREHVNAEQRARCDRAEMLHSLCHMSDDALCEALVNGHFPWSNLTSADIRLNRKLRGPCVQCLEGKYHVAL